MSSQNPSTAAVDSVLAGQQFVSDLATFASVGESSNLDPFTTEFEVNNSVTKNNIDLPADPMPDPR